MPGPSASFPGAIDGERFQSQASPMADDKRFKLNGKPVRVAAGGSETLLWALRTELALTGTKYGCGEGHCGACTVLVNGEAVRACQVHVSEVAGKEVTTIEGLAERGKLHP